MTWKQLKQYLFARLHRPTEPILWDYPLGRIELEWQPKWDEINNTNVSPIATFLQQDEYERTGHTPKVSVTFPNDAIAYSLTDTPIFQNLSEEDYNYFASIPNNM